MRELSNHGDGQQRERQGEMLLSWDELPKSPGHAFYDRLQEVLLESGFDGFVEGLCKPYYAPVMGARSLPPGRYFRMHLVGYFEGIHSERGLEWRCTDSLSLREFLRLGLREAVPDHSWLSKTRARLPLEVHDAVFAWVLVRLAERNLVKGERIGIDASTMEANAAMRSIRRRDSGESYRSMLTRMAVPMLERHIAFCGAAPRQAAADGGFASRNNLAEAKARGVQDMAFHKKGGLRIEDMVRSHWVYRKLRNFRAGIEAGISCLKRAYGLARCTWRGLDHFKAYVWSAVVAYNLALSARLRSA